ncbi:MAG: coproporphyrinogen III oxidase, partial [Puniceicoccales bacterium]
MPEIDPDAVARYLRDYQERLTAHLEALEPGCVFRRDSWERSEGGGGESRVTSDGPVWEKAGVNFSDVQGKQLPASASAHRPHLAGRSFRAMGVSMVIHPRNPYAPTEVGVVIKGYNGNVVRNLQS